MQGQLRPTFRVQHAEPVDRLMESLRQRLRTPLPYGRAISAGRCIEFFVDEHDKHLWSPYLSVQAHEEEGETVLFARFSPTPEVWTFLMMFYAGNACLAAFAMIFGYVQWTLEDAPWGLLGIPIGLFSITAVHLSSVWGQRATREQMEKLRKNLEALLEPAPEPPEATPSSRDAATRTQPVSSSGSGSIG